MSIVVLAPTAIRTEVAREFLHRVRSRSNRRQLQILILRFPLDVLTGYRPFKCYIV